MDARSEEIVEAVRATDFLLGHDEWGATWIAAYRARLAAGSGQSRRRRERRCRHRGAAARGRPRQARLRAGRRRDKEARVPPGRRSSTRELERDRDRLDLRRPRNVQEVQGARRSGEQCDLGVDPRAFSAEELRAGWRLACRAPAEEDLVVEVPPLQTRPKAALAGVGRHVILRPGGAEALPGADRADARGPGLRPRARARRDGRRRAAGAARAAAHARQDAARRRLEGDRRARRRPAARRRAGRHDRRRFAIAFDLGTTTVVATLLDLETGRPRRCARC